ncbi:hypothetical protein I8U20_08965 [Thermoactinomyces intermedius]|uniref:Uncharacterized protein n=1 Tax=Thermoactinomyces intermedius TaxID=2024 RepID=A0A8I1AA30_THEIN|nr:hypothetical protein [Thermoactinomyces intermedius]
MTYLQIKAYDQTELFSLISTENLDSFENNSLNHRDELHQALNNFAYHYISSLM